VLTVSHWLLQSVGVRVVLSSWLFEWLGCEVLSVVLRVVRNSAIPVVAGVSKRISHVDSVGPWLAHQVAHVSLVDWVCSD